VAAPDSTGGDSVGAVQKLATTVIVGLVGLATLLVVYLANEPNRRAEEAVEQEHVAVERGIQTYIQNCVVCHGPAGEGYSEPGAEETGRIGMPLGGGTELGLAATELNQSEDTTTREERYNLIVNTLQNGRALMPAFGRGADGGALLNDEQIHELALMIQHVDWDHVYNETVAELGGYPTPGPAPARPAAAEAAQAPGGSGGESAESGQGWRGRGRGWRSGRAGRLHGDLLRHLLRARGAVDPRQSGCPRLAAKPRGLAPQLLGGRTGHLRRPAAGRNRPLGDDQLRPG
jgi:mono/diheme cytochrome c family protein